MEGYTTFDMLWRTHKRPVTAPDTRWDVTQPSRGLGDTVAKLTAAVGIQRIIGECAGCLGRQEKMNKVLPYDK